MTLSSSGLKCLFIVNPASARGTTLGVWSRLRQQINAQGITFDEHVTREPGEATEIARKALKSGVERVIAVGGDGTLSEIVNGYFDSQGQPINVAAAIGLLASGTGSDFRRSLGMTNQRKSISALFESGTRHIDAACAHFRGFSGDRAKRFFINVASFGLGGDVSASVNRWRNSLPRWIGGRARFSAAAIAALGRYKNVRVSMRFDDGREIQINSNLIVVANGKFAGGGMMLAPDAELDDGFLDVIVTDEATRWDVIKELPRIQRGDHLKNPKVTAMRARVVSIDAEEPMAVDLDGETVGYTPANITLLPAAIRFVSF